MLYQSWNYSLCSNSIPEPILPGVCHEASYLCCVNVGHQALLIFFPSLSLNVFPSLARQLLDIAQSTHSCPQACTVAHQLASPPHLVLLSNEKNSLLLSSSLLRA